MIGLPLLLVKEIGKIKKGIVKETLEKFERQKSLIETSKKENSTFEESPRRKLKDKIEQERTSTIVQDKVKEKIERQNSEKFM